MYILYIFGTTNVKVIPNDSRHLYLYYSRLDHSKTMIETNNTKQGPDMGVIAPRHLRGEARRAQLKDRFRLGPARTERRRGSPRARSAL